MPITLQGTNREGAFVDLPLEFFGFPGGERHVRIKPLEQGVRVERLLIEAHLTSPSDILDLLLLNDAICYQFPRLPRILTCPYLPYARQDRVGVKGEPLSLKVMANLINSCGFDQVNIWDVHSDVAKPLFPATTVFVPQHLLVKRFVEDLDKFDYVVSPDAGALKKIYALNKDVLCASKTRDPITGNLSNCKVEWDLTDSLEDKKLLVVDDLVDGGGTFVQLAKELKKFGVLQDELSLYVTHGIFSKGMEPFEGYFDAIYCPNVLNQEFKDKFVNNRYEV